MGCSRPPSIPWPWPWRWVPVLWPAVSPGEKEHLADTHRRAIRYRGTALVDILQPCVSFNHVNTFAWYKERCYKLPDTYDPENRSQALEKAGEFFEKIPLGVIYRNRRKTVFEDQFAVIRELALVNRKFDRQAYEEVVRAYEA